MKLKLFAVLLLAFPSAGQVNLLILRDVCPTASTPRLLVIVPNATTPICAELGTGLTLDLQSNPPRINAAANPAADLRPVVLSGVIPDAPASQTTMDISLTSTPTGVMFAFFRSSRVGADIATAVVPDGSRVVRLTLPAYRPFTASDTWTLVYWTSDRPAPLAR